jgi:glycosyltransferase involved in cell wall biosynthesis
MTCSVVVATVGRPRQLAACRSALDALQPPPGGYEVIVVDDAERRGPAVARNAGVARAEGELVAFTDDDCEPEPGWLVALHERWAGRGDVGVGGTVVNALGRNPFAAASQVVHESAHAWANRDVPRFFATNNLALPRAALLDVGGFDEGLRFSEDRELCDRWLAADLALEHEPRAVVHHAHLMGARGFLTQHARYGRGAWRFRAAQVRAGRRPAPIEPAFYDRLLRDAARRSSRTAALVAAAQLANAVGFAAAAISDHGRLPRP